MSRHICFFNSNRKWGGGEKWHFEMASALAAKGFDVILASNPHGELTVKAKKASIRTVTYCISNLSFLNLFKVVQIWRMLKYREIDTMIINLPSDLKVAALAARLAGNIRVIYRRGSAIPIKSSLLNKLIFHYFVDDILVNSGETGRTILANDAGLFPAGKIRIIYNGLDLDEFDKQVGKPVYKRQGDELILAAAGRLARQKGYDLLFEIVRKLAGSGLNFRILIAGDGELRDDLEKTARDTGIYDHLLFLGFVENIRPVLDASDIFLLTSRWEGFGYVLVEAMAAGKPVIAFDSSSNPEIILDGQTGFLIRDFNTDAFADKILQISRDPETLMHLGQNGRKRVEEKFTMERAVGELVAFLG